MPRQRCLESLISVETRGGSIWISGPDKVIAECYAMVDRPGE